MARLGRFPGKERAEILAAVRDAEDRPVAPVDSPAGSSIVAEASNMPATKLEVGDVAATSVVLSDRRVS